MAQTISWTISQDNSANNIPDITNFWKVSDNFPDNFLDIFLDNFLDNFPDNFPDNFLDNFPDNFSDNSRTISWILDNFSVNLTISV